ncbi:MAG: MarR family winged helix-turn-helix transcriptional regulator [Pseudorhodobacter sp.]
MTRHDERQADADLRDFSLSGFTPYRTAVVAQLLSEGLSYQYRERFGISIPDWRVLVHLIHSGGGSVRDIEQQVVMEKSKVSRAVARLEARKLISKRPNPGDKRLLHLALTPKGERMMRELLPLADNFQQRVEACLGADLEAFERGLDRIWDTFGKSME